MTRIKSLPLTFLLIIALLFGCKKIAKVDVANELPPEKKEANWTTLGRNIKRQHFALQNVNPPLEVAWKAKVKSVIADHPLAIDDVIFAPTVSGRMLLLNSQTGEKISDGKLSPAIEHAPSIHEQNLIVGATLGNRTLIRLNLENSKKEAAREYPYVNTSPLIAEDKIFFGTQFPVFFCANLESGIQIWEFKTRAPIYSSPAFKSPNVIFADEKGWLYALDASSGLKLWEYELASITYAHPVLDDSLAYIGTVDGNMNAIEIETGKLRWKKPFTGAIYNGAALYKNVLYFGHNAHEVVALRKETGETIWKFKTNGIVNTVPLPSPDYVYATSWDKNLYVLDRFTGEEVYRFPLRRPSKTSLIIHGNLLLVHMANDFLLALGSKEYLGEDLGEEK